MSKSKITLERIEPEYIYITIPAEYICVYHRILAMLADYGEEMLQDCKAACKDRNSGVIECYNMFNAAVAARKLGKDKLAETLIKYIKAKINQIYKGKDNSTSFVFPVDENGMLKAFVSCGERPAFRIDSRDMGLYEHKFSNGFDEHFKLGKEDGYEDEDLRTISVRHGLTVDFQPFYEKGKDGKYHPCIDLGIYCDGDKLEAKDTIYQYYFDHVPVIRFDDVTDLEGGLHLFTVVITYKGETRIVNKELYYENS